MAKRTFTDESLATLVDETKLYVDSKSYHSNKSILDNTTASYTTDEKTKLSGIATGAEVNQNAFSNVKVGSTTVAADSKTDTIEFVGNNVTITPDATNDKVTFAVADGTTSAKGIVKLTDSVTSTDTTTAATPNSVKSAYDLANTAKTNAATAQSNLDAHIDDKNNPHGVDYEQIGAVPITRKVNNKELSEDISLTAEDINAFPCSWVNEKNIDLNTLLIGGSYTLNYDAESQDTYNLPTNNVTWINLIVLGNSSRLTQIATLPFSHEQTVYVRYKHDSSWSTWKDMSAFLPLTGGTISNALTVKGSTILDSNTNINGRLSVGVNYGGEGGEIALNASPDTPTQSGVILDQCNSRFRIFGISSADGTTRTGVGTPLVIDPYEKSISGGYYVDFGTGNFNNLVVKNEANFLRNIVGNYGVIFRNDGESTYILLTNSGDPYGSWNNLRPLSINNQTGLVHIDNGLSVTATNAAEARARNISAGTSGSPAANGDIFIKYS